MSGNALRDLNVFHVPGLERKNDGSSKGSFITPYIENSNEEVTRCQKDSEVNIGNNGVETGNSDVEYIVSENLTDLPDVDSSLNTLLARLDSKDWVLICEALNNVRQLAIYHKEKLLEMLGVVIPLLVKSLKNPRSAVCKTAIMTSADIFKVYGDSVIDSFDPLLVQLLLKSSQDKRFVCEAAETALVAMTTWVSPSLLLPKLQPYLKSKNPRIRAKGLEGIKAYGIDNLIQIAASQLSDQLPESREAARMLALEVRAIHDKSHVLPGEDSTQLVDSDSWEAFCQTRLSPLSAHAILRVTPTPKEGLVLGC